MTDTAPQCPLYALQQYVSLTATGLATYFGSTDMPPHNHWRVVARTVTEAEQQQRRVTYAVVPATPQGHWVLDRPVMCAEQHLAAYEKEGGGDGTTTS